MPVMDSKIKDPKRVSAVLNEHARLGFLVKKAQQLSRLQQLLDDSLPAELRNRAQVMNIQGSSLIIGVTTGVIATRLNYQAPELLKKLQQHSEFSYIRSMRCKVSV